MRDAIFIGITGMICITIIVVVGCGMGHDGTLLSGGMATIAGITSAFGAYNFSKAKHSQWTNQSQPKQSNQDTQPGKDS